MASRVHPTHPLIFEEYPNRRPLYTSAGSYIGSSHMVNYFCNSNVIYLGSAWESPFHTTFSDHIVYLTSWKTRYGRLHSMDLRNVHISQISHLEIRCVLHDGGDHAMCRPTCRPRMICDTIEAHEILCAHTFTCFNCALTHSFAEFFVVIDRSHPIIHLSRPNSPPRPLPALMPVPLPIHFINEINIAEIDVSQ